MAGISISDIQRNILEESKKTTSSLMANDSSINPAKWTHERLVRSINEFEARLDATEEVAARLVNFSARETISIDNIGYMGPDLVVFFGKNADGAYVELMQHYSQVNVLLVAAKVEKGEGRRIGFQLMKTVTESNPVAEQADTKV